MPDMQRRLLVLALGLCAFVHAGEFLQCSEPKTAGAPSMRQDDMGAPEVIYGIEAFGPLAGLLGTWESQNGVNYVHVPKYEENGQFNGENFTASFTRLRQTYSETVTFKPIAAHVLNRGYSDADHSRPDGQSNQIIMGVSYHTEIRMLTQESSDSDDGAAPEHGVIHVEDGQPGNAANWTIARMTSIPHGVTLMAFGTNTTVNGTYVKDSLQEMLYEGEPGEWNYQPTNLGTFHLPRGYDEC